MCRWIEQPSRHTTRRASEQPAPARGPSPYRVSDAEREEVIAQLRTHTADGRLTLDEFEVRVEEVLRSRTGVELDAALRELPPIATPATSQAPRHRQPMPPVVRRAIPALLLVAAVSLVAGHVIFWPFFVGFFAFGGHGRFGPSRHHHGGHHGDDRREDAVTYV